MAIYNHFDGVNGVIDPLWTRASRCSHDAVTVTVATSSRLHERGPGLSRFALENPGLYTIMFLHRFRNFEPSLASVQVAARTYQALVTHCRALSGDRASSPRDARATPPR